MINNGNSSIITSLVKLPYKNKSGDEIVCKKKMIQNLNAQKIV